MYVCFLVFLLLWHRTSSYLKKVKRWICVGRVYAFNWRLFVFFSPLFSFAFVNDVDLDSCLLRRTSFSFALHEAIQPCRRWVSVWLFVCLFFKFWRVAGRAFERSRGKRDETTKTHAMQCNVRAYFTLTFWVVFLCSRHSILCWRYKSRRCFVFRLCSTEGITTRVWSMQKMTLDDGAYVCWCVCWCVCVWIFACALDRGEQAGSSRRFR